MKAKILFVLISSLIALIFSFSFSAKAAEVEIFSEDFEKGLENWNLESGWEVVKENENQVLKGTEHTFARTYLEGEIKTLEAKVKILKGGLHISFRTNEMPDGQSRYFLGLSQAGSYLQKEMKMNFKELARGGRGISLGKWHEVRIEIENQKIRTFVDKSPLFEVEDKELIKNGNISFETLENSLVYVDEVRAEIAVPERREIKSGAIFPQGEHKGDLTVEAGDFLILENGKFSQFGNIYLKDRANLVIRNSELKISRYEKLLNHWGIELSDSASLEIENSKLLPGEETLFVIYGREKSRVRLKDSPTQIHLFQMFNRAKALVENSEIVGEIGGLVSAFDQAEVKVINSKIGAVNLYIPKEAIFEASGLGTGLFKDWNLQRDTKVGGINYNIILQNTQLVPDKIGPGPFERGWPVFIDSSAKVKIKDSELRKVVIELHDEKAEFANFVVEKPSNFNYRDIELENIKVMGQWGIFPHGFSEVKVKDSEEFWTFIYDDSKLTLVNTHLNEFDPRNFRGEIIFENSRWDTAAEIIGDNDFTISGSLEIGKIGGFSWENSKVTRIFKIIGKPDSHLSLIKDDKIIWSGMTDKEGRAELSLKFDDNNFNDVWLIKDNFGHENELTFFSKTPVDMEEGIISKYLQKIKRKVPGSPPPPPLILKVFVVFASISFLLFLFFRLRKRRLKKKQRF